MNAPLHISDGSLSDIVLRTAEEQTVCRAKQLNRDVESLLRRGWDLDQLELVYYPFPDCSTEVRIKRECLLDKIKRGETIFFPVIVEDVL